MRENRGRLAGLLAAALLGVLAVAATIGLLAAPAKAQTYPITQPSHNTTTTTEPPTTTTTVVHHAALAFTGADIGVTMGAAAVALGLGGGLVLVSRKRKAAQ